MIKIILPLLLPLAIVVSCKPKEPVEKSQLNPKQELIEINVPEKENMWVFILAGQSNMAGRGLVEPQDTISSQRVFTINKNGGIIPAKEPLHFYEPSAAGLDCGLSFGKTLVEQLPDSISVLLIPTAVGGSTISQWLGDSTHRDVKLLTNFKEKVRIGQAAGQLKGILWHQGEGDANPNDIPLYRDRLSRLFLQFRKIAGNENLTILIGELGSFSDNNDNWQKINAEINRYSASDEHTGTVHTSDLKHKGDKIHFDSDGQRIMGERFAEEYIRLKRRAY